jgi:membrane-bound serine protease (ClpP class)
VALLVALALAFLVLPSPWGIVAVGAGAIVEVGEAVVLWRLSHRRAPATGLESLLGAEATVASACRPFGQVRIRGELWQARCDHGADEGDTVRIREVDGLQLVVEPA